MGRNIWTGGSGYRFAQIQGIAMYRPADFDVARVRGQRGIGEQRDCAHLPGGGHDISDHFATDLEEV